jgi:hypothetical protein
MLSKKVQSLGLHPTVHVAEVLLKQHASGVRECPPMKITNRELHLVELRTGDGIPHGGETPAMFQIHRPPRVTAREKEGVRKRINVIVRIRDAVGRTVLGPHNDVSRAGRRTVGTFEAHGYLLGLGCIVTTHIAITRRRKPELHPM